MANQFALHAIAFILHNTKSVMVAVRKGTWFLLRSTARLYAVLAAVRNA
jgi:hypothetical protein